MSPRKLSRCRLIRRLILGACLWASINTVFVSPILLTAADKDVLTGYQAKVAVRDETRLDWMFALANQSPPEVPASWTKGYQATSQQYELYVPANYSAQKSYPLILFISAGNTPAGRTQLQTLCREQEVIFASPYDAGNNTPQDRRTRIVLDVLDDLTRRYHIDPDRTYIGGFSGGGRVACAIAFALPEYFGGVFPVCAAGDLRDEVWLRQRACDRLSVAYVTGETDFNRGEIERFRGPMWADVGLRSKIWMVPKMGHSIPGGELWLDIFQWLEAGREARQELAKQHPASRISFEKPWSRHEWAEVLSTEARSRLKARETLYSGLMQLQGISTRWPDLPAGRAARKLLEEYEAKGDRPWEEDDIAEQRKALIARARALDAYATGELPPQYAGQRDSMLQGAIQLWGLILRDNQDAKAVAQAKQRLPLLQQQLDKLNAGKPKKE